jgi:hypothetical protein
MSPIDLVDSSSVNPRTFKSESPIDQAGPIIQIGHTA